MAASVSLDPSEAPVSVVLKLFLPLVALVAAAGIVAAVADVGTAAADELRTPHGQMVPETPRRDMPMILDGRVYASTIVGNRVIAGGTFTRIELRDGSVVSQRYLAAWDVDTGEFDHDFRPTLNDSVRSLLPGDDTDTVFVGGKFSRWDGSPRHHVAKYDFARHRLVPGWDASVDGIVKTMDRHGDRLFIGGGFSEVNGRSRNHLAEISASTGSISSFDIGVTGSRECGRRGDGLWTCITGALVRSVDVTPDGSRLVVTHRGTHLGGARRVAAGIVDITGGGARVTSWSTDVWGDSPVWIVEAEVAPDGSYFAVTNIIGNFPPLNDTVMAFPVSGGADAEPLWVTQMFDSVYGIGISDVAIYVGGHFCWTEGPDAPTGSWDTWPGASGNVYSCARTGGGGFPGTVNRHHLAALDPDTGLALAWNPGSNSWNGARSMVVTERGLLIGFDSDRVGGVRTGGLALMDLGARAGGGGDGGGGDGGGGEGPSCQATVTVDGQGSVVTLSWTGVVDDSYAVRRDGAWIADTGSRSYQDVDAADGVHSYSIRWRSGGVRHDLSCTPDPVVVGAGPAGPWCVAAPIDGRSVDIRWGGFEDSVYSVRRDDRWIASTAGTDHIDAAVSPGEHSYAIRWWSQGVRHDVECDPNPVEVR